MRRKPRKKHAAPDRACRASSSTSPCLLLALELLSVDSLENLPIQERQQKWPKILRHTGWEPRGNAAPCISSRYPRSFLMSMTQVPAMCQHASQPQCKSQGEHDKPTTFPASSFACCIEVRNDAETRLQPILLRAFCVLQVKLPQHFADLALDIQLV